MLRRLFCPSLAVILSLAGSAPAGPPQPDDGQRSTWPQFRGPNGCAAAAEGMKLPVEFGPDKNVLWKVALPPGHSSPCIWGDRIFLTGFDAVAKKLEACCLDRNTGKTLWRRPAPAEMIEKVHEISTPATGTPASDGERVYVYFASFGLLCYDFAGKEVWKKPLPVPATRFGAGTSPIVVGDLVLLSGEYSPKPFLLAVDRRTGETVWQRERLPTGDGYATPVVWRHDGADEIIVHSPLRVAAYDLKDGVERWWVIAQSAACSSPVAGDGKLFVATWAHGGETEDRVKLPSFDELLAKYDKDKDGMLSKQEFPPDLDGFRRAEAAHIHGAAIKLIWFFDQLDANKDGKIGRFEWFAVQAFASMPVEHGLLALKPGGQGDVTKTHIAWKEKRGIPEVPSPVYYRGRIYMVRDGGIISCLDAATGKLVYRERLGPSGPYFASLVAGDGKLYAAGERGVVTVFAAGDTLQVLAKNDLGEPIFATPALVEGKIYLRTKANLYAFGE